MQKSTKDNCFPATMDDKASKKEKSPQKIERWVARNVLRNRQNIN